MIKINNIKLPSSYTENDLKNTLCKQLKINKNLIKNIIYLKKSIDARKKPKIFYNLSVAIELVDPQIEGSLNLEKFEYNIERLSFEKIDYKTRPIVVGFGPSGMFTALSLSLMGLNPIVIEQGECVEDRLISVNKFWENGILNKYSNVQFGEGGAGTFSDGKLNTNLNNHYCKLVINELYHHGAPKEILYQSKPHIGSDKLIAVVKNIRKHITDLGGQIMFNTKLTNINIIQNQICSIDVLNVKTNKTQTLKTNILALCLGHSARDTFKLLKDKNVNLKQKPFAMGVRIEQLADNVNKMQYGESYDKSLPNADYKLAVHLPNGRSMFTFCMCPGGVVVASSSDQNEIVTNGMSYFARDNAYSNSALLVNVTESDYNSDDVLAGVYFQEKYEKLAYSLGGGNFKAPVQTVGSFLSDKQNSGECSYKPNYTFANLKDCLPDFVYQSLKLGLLEFNKKYKTFAHDSDILIGVETRSSSPITICRDQTYQSNINGIFPCGEGAGYAGGIVSSAQDGIKIAEAIYTWIKEGGV